MADYLSVAAKLVLNVHDLNNEGSVGNATDIRQIRMVDESGRPLPEMPAVSGRMMKHWHLAHMLTQELTRGTEAKLCDQCKIWEPERQPTDEDTGITACIICDAHGFLCAKPKGAEDAKGKSLRRASCVNFSWLLPVLSQSDQGEMLVPQAKQVIHSRVAPAAGSGEEKSSQMIFYKSYASGIYAFVAYIDLGRIGKPLKGEGITDQEEIKRRQKLAVQSLLPIVTGTFGASQSHALPHARCLGLLAALSTAERPIPNLISPIYSKGFEESIALLKALGDGVSRWTFGEGFEDAKSSVQEVFDGILEKL